MKKLKKLFALLIILIVVCAVTIGISKYKAHEDTVAEQESTVLAIDADTVTALSWSGDTGSFSFHKEDGTWIYDDDENFPVSADKITSLLENFSSFTTSFTVESPSDLSQYGLDDPTCTINITADGTDYVIELGGFSTMDEERYVSVGDGNVYLAETDPNDAFSIAITDLIENDTVPSLNQVSAISFTGDESYSIEYSEDNSENTYRDDDVYFTDGNPLDTDAVNSYVQTVNALSLSDYASYNASSSELEEFGLADPDLTASIDYTDADGNVQTFTFSIGQNQSEASSESTSSETTSYETTTETETVDETEDTSSAACYLRIEGSSIIYIISNDTYNSLMKYTYNDLRHQEVISADVADIDQIDITLDGQSYTLTSDGTGDDKTWSLNDQAVDADNASDLTDALSALSSSGFTNEQSEGEMEISLTLHLALDGDPTVKVDLYRYNGSVCLAVVDDNPLCFVSRSAVVDVKEAINAIVLD